MRGHRSRFEDRDAAPAPWETQAKHAVPLPRTGSRSGAVTLDQGWAEWLVEGRLPCGGTSMLVGEPGAGKSALARDLALAVARGRPWLDFRTRQGPVLYVHLEGDRLNLRAAFAKLGLAPQDALHFVHSLQMSELRERIRERAKSLEPVLIVIDGLLRLLHAEELNDAGAQSSALDRILDLSHETRSHVLLVHDLAGPLAHEMGQLLGSTRNTLDTIFMLSRVRDERLLRSIQQQGRAVLTPIRVPNHEPPPPSVPRRASPPSPPAPTPGPVTVTAPTQPSHPMIRPETRLWHETPERPAAPPKAQPRPRSTATPLPDPGLRREILSYLRLSSRLATQREISEFVQETNPDAIFSCLGQMCSERKLIRVGSGEQGDPYRYTGCDLIKASPRAPWLTRVRPWARVAPVRLTSNQHHL